MSPFTQTLPFFKTSILYFLPEDTLLLILPIIVPLGLIFVTSVIGGFLESIGLSSLLINSLETSSIIIATFPVDGIKHPIPYGVLIR